MITKSEVKYIQSLGHKKFRDELKQFTAEGPKIIIELLNSPSILLKALYATEEWWNVNKDVYESLAPGMAIEIKEYELEKISALSTPNQVMGIFHQPIYDKVTSFNNCISLMLDGIQDPGNMGTIIRIADWFGAEYIIASEESAEIYNPKVVQATMGSIGRVQVIYDDLLRLIKAIPAVPIYAASLEGKDITEYKKITEGIILIGNESKGIQVPLLQSATHQVTISKRGKAESLNAAVAAGIILSHLV
ncbi:MAG: RNA methyltransferase [Chitinophagaceae bacterium]|nr:RNA methyltransferase [Chitinophagaceae bacterium]